MLSKNLSTVLLAVLVVVGPAACRDLSPTGAFREYDSLLKEHDVPATGNFCQGCRSLVSFASQFNSSATYKDLFLNFCEAYYPPSTDYRGGPCPIFVEALFFTLHGVDPVYHCDEIGACPNQKLATDLSSVNQQQAGPDIFCKTCEQVISQLKAQLEDPTFTRYLKRQIASVCEYLKLVQQDKECNQLLDKYLDQAIDFVRHINPLVYCQSVRICAKKPPAIRASILPSLLDFNDFGIETSVSIGSLANKETVVANKPRPNCVFCQYFVRELFKFLKENRTEASIQHALGKVCYIFKGEKRRQCEELVHAYSEEIVQILLDETDPELVCTLLEQCTYEKPNLKQATESRLIQAEPNLKQAEPISLSQFISILDPQVQVGSLTTCIECKLFIKYLQDTVSDPGSQDEMKNWLEKNLCDAIQDESTQESCKQLVENKSQAFFEAVANQLEPEMVCIDFRACRPRASKLVINEENDSLVSLSPLPDPPKQAAVTVDKKEGGLCENCVEIISKIDDYLSSHPIDHDVSVLVDQVCNKIPQDSVKNECTFLVKKFGDEIVQAISTMDNPRQLCAKIMLCDQ